MFIVKIKGKRHSIWESNREAWKQVDTLLNHGYKSIEVSYTHVTEFFENGHYFV